MFYFFSLDFSLVVGIFLFFLFIFFFFLFIYFFFFSKLVIMDWEIMSFNGFDIKFTFLFDWVSLSFVSIVLFISTSVIFFSFYYMMGDVFMFRFIFLVFLFVVSMLVVILVPNLIALLLGWDGLGLVSFCLVIYYQNFKSLVSGMITVLANRVGDVMILLSIGWMVSIGGWNYFFFDNFFCCFWVMFCVCLAGMTKSAQFPFCSWLPAAMAAPTPVSALVHSSTLVTAGVHLILRFWLFLSNYSVVVVFLFFVSSVTMFLSGFSALFETDLKKIIALSTLSQLSVMLFAISNGFCLFGLFHLYTHALFKALLFLCAGTIIHCFSHVQDFRSLGFCWSKIPFVMTFMNFSNLALCGFPFLGGFYSKDLVLESFFFSSWSIFFFLFLFFSTVFTVAYSVRLTLYSMFFMEKGFVVDNESDSEFFVVFPIFLLGLGSIFGGSFFFFLFFVDFSEFLLTSFFLKILIFSFFFWGSLLALWLVFMDFSFDKKVFINYFFYYGSSMWNLQFIFSQFFLNFPFFLSFYYLYKLDRGYLELFGGKGILFVFSWLGNFFHYISFKSVLYFFSFLFFFMIFMFI
uniref:NADH-ubiquinone oxidoreductase chain 5 n=1 Tax=Nemertopsis sp. WYS-2013 TaxID=1432317 RepID=A0A0A7AEA9_9BILA|nr:NADH dehydrogenase subunit 5 [Nemertopsis sp. WYS-2013]